MRDAQLIRERSTWWPLIARLLRTVWTVGLVAGAFTLGRWSAAEWPPAPVQLSRVEPAKTSDASEIASVATAQDGSPAPAGQMPAAPATKRSDKQSRSERRQADAQALGRPLHLVPPSGPEALADGLLPHEVGTAQVGEYSVLISAFESREEARAFCQQLTRRGFHPFVKQHVPNVPANRRHQVRLGRFATQAAAEDYRVRLARAAIRATVVPTPS